MDQLRGTDWHGAFVDDDLIGINQGGQVVGHTQDKGEVGGAIGTGRGGQGQEDDLGFPDPVGQAGGEMEAFLFDIAFKQDIQAGLVDGDFAGLQACDFVSVDVDAGDVIACFRKADPGDEPYVSCSDDGDFHKWVKIERKGHRA